MIRQTSIEAFQEIQESGLLGKRQKHAYNTLYQYGPLTGQELSKKMGIPGQWKRCSELKKRGVCFEVGEKVCSVTGQKAILWDVNDKKPTKTLEQKKITDSIRLEFLIESRYSVDEFMGRWAVS